jgi:anti-anti-sigma factor
MALILEIHTHRNDDHSTIEAGGELDCSTHDRLLAELERELGDAAVSTVTLDLRKLFFCDSAGLATLLTAGRLARVKGVNFAILTPADPDLSGLFAATGMEERLPLRGPQPAVADGAEAGGAALSAS